MSLPDSTRIRQAGNLDNSQEGQKVLKPGPDYGKYLGKETKDLIDSAPAQGLQ